MKGKADLSWQKIRLTEAGLIIVERDNPPREIRIPCLDEQSYRMFWSNRRELGTAEGFELQYCVVLGLKHCPDFLRRVVAYRVVSRKQKTVRCRMIMSGGSETSVRRKTEALQVIFYENRPWERQTKGGKQ